MLFFLISRISESIKLNLCLEDTYSLLKLDMRKIFSYNVCFFDSFLISKNDVDSYGFIHIFVDNLRHS